MDLIGDLRNRIELNRLAWLATNGCKLFAAKKAIACFHLDDDTLNAVSNIRCEGDEEATTAVQEALAIIEHHSGRKAEVWLNPYCRPPTLPNVLTSLGLRASSVFFTLVAEPETVRAREVRNLLIWEVRRESRPTTIDAWAVTFQHAFERSITMRETEAWKKAMEDQKARFFVGFRQAPTTLGGPWPGHPAVVGQLLTSHEIGGIYRIGTVPTLRGNGYASAMITHIAHKAAEAGLPHVYATIRKPKNCRIFEGVGLQEVTPQTQIWR